jgi:hypothetical protein
VKGGWEHAHSGPVPASFKPDKFFLDHKSAHVPPILGNQLERLEERQDLPFTRQWAFEWRNLMDKIKAPASGYPYYFADASLERSGIRSQFCQRQSEIYRSAFLRTFACAVDSWKMPIRNATEFCLDTLPLNRGFIAIDPIQRPSWLSSIPEKSSEPGAPLKTLLGPLLKLGANRPGMRPVSMKIPLAVEVSEFAELSIMAVLATKDFVPDADMEVRLTGGDALGSSRSDFL